MWVNRIIKESSPFLLFVNRFFFKIVYKKGGQNCLKNTVHMVYEWHQIAIVYSVIKNPTKAFTSFLGKP